MLRPPALPTLFNATAESLLSDTRRHLAAAKAVQDAIVSSVTAETAIFANTLLPLVKEENQRLYDRQLIEFYAFVSIDEKVREASLKAAQLFSEFDSETAMRDDLYNLVVAVRDKNEELSTESRRLMEMLILDFEQNGLALSEEGRVRLRQVNRDLDLLKEEYIKGCEKDPDGIWFTRGELEGVSDDVLSELEHGSGVNEGKLLLKSAGIQYYDVMGSAKREETRRKVYVERGTRCKSNVHIMEKIIVLREEKARILGHSSFNELRMAKNMEKSPQKIKGFLEDLLHNIKNWRDVSIEGWRRQKKEDLEARGEPDDGKFYAWDRSFYFQKCLQQDEANNADIVSEYFALHETIKRMLLIFERVFGINFVEIIGNDRDILSQGAGGDALVWHEDVQLFAVWDDSDGSGKKDEFLGYLYMDMYPRPGKRSGFCDLPIRPVRKSLYGYAMDLCKLIGIQAFTDVEGYRKFTSTGLICNFNKPTKLKPSLLKHNQVVLLFHELGHGIHDLVAKTEYARFHGASTAGDFNEAPSQMLEEWCWCLSTLRFLSQHYSNLSVDYLQKWRIDQQTDNAEPPQALPNDIIERMCNNKKDRGLNRCLTLLDMSLFDLAINSVTSHKAAEDLDTTKLFHANSHKNLGIDIPEDLPAVQASEVIWFVVSGMYIYLMLVSSSVRVGRVLTDLYVPFIVHRSIQSTCSMLDLRQIQ